MPEKHLRLGFTECTLLFINWYLINNKVYNKDIHNWKQNLNKWLYTTSGYYDNTIHSNYMDATHVTTEISSNPPTYNTYFNTLYEFIKNADNFSYGVHYPKNSNEFIEFISSLNIQNQKANTIDYFFNKIKNNKILIISPFAKLIQQQYESGNCIKIYNNFPNVDKISYYTNIYTFFNKGPHNNILETIDYIFNDISSIVNSIDYNIVVISAGAYSNLLAKKFYDINKDVITLGGNLQDYFGILNRRSKDKLKNNVEIQNNKYWITDIPDEYKPDDYMKIENGCYW
jgi:hypothetical protein